MAYLTKISLISENLSGGGAQKVAVNLANDFCSKGYRVDLVLSSDETPYGEQLHPHVKVVRLNAKRVRYAYKRLRQYLKERQPDYVLSTLRSLNVVTGLAARGHGKNMKVYFREANTLHKTLREPWLKRKLHLALMKLSYSMADGIIANSEDTKNDLVKNGIISPENAVVIPNPVIPPNYRVLAEQNIDEAWLADPEIKVVLSIGKLQVQKNFPLLIDAFKTVSEVDAHARLLIIGEGPELENIKHRIELYALQSRVKIVGFKGNIFPYMKRAHVFVLPSSWEGFGNVLVEALSVGTSVVSTDCPGGPKAILDDGKFGDLVPMDDPEALAERILLRLDHPMAPHGLETRAQDFSVQTISDRYFDYMRGQNESSQKEN